MTFQSLLGTELPIIQAPMAGSQVSPLTIAVSAAGGLGSLPCAMLGFDAIREEVAAIRAQTDRPFNLNFFCHTPPSVNQNAVEEWRDQLKPFYTEYDIDSQDVEVAAGRASFSEETVALLEEIQPPIVSFHFGLPEQALLDRTKAIGAKVFSSATTLAEALWLQEHGVDAVIAQGLEAGGHRGIFLSRDVTTQIGTMALVPQLVERLSVPVIAAGGIADAKGVKAALDLGAIAAQVGTAYLLCPEAATTKIHREALESQASAHTALTNVFSGRPARAIVNRVIEELGPMQNSMPEFPLPVSAMAPLRAKAEEQGSGDFSPMWAGQNTSGCKPVPAAELTHALVAEL